MQKRFVANISLNNSAFEDPNELPRILRAMAQDIENDPEYDRFRNAKDINGNIVGIYAIKPETYFE